MEEKGSSGTGRSQLNRRELCSRADSLGKGLEEGEGWLIGDSLGKVYTELHAGVQEERVGRAVLLPGGWAPFSVGHNLSSLDSPHPRPAPTPPPPRAPTRPNAI